MNLTDADFLKQCESLHLAAQRTWGQRFLARRVELRLAGGTEVTGYTDYTSGHDFRYVDWNRCARHDELLSKQFRGNEDLYTYFLLDCSRSMQTGNAGKFDMARRLAAVLGYLAIANVDCVGVTAFAGGITAELPPLRGRKHIPRLLNFLTGLSAEETATSLRATAEQFVRRRQPTGLAVLISDLFDPTGFEAAIDILLRRGYEPYVLQVLDPFDCQPELLGDVKLFDVESQRSHRQNIDETDLANYRQVFNEFSESLKRYCFRYSISLTQTRSDVPLQQCVQQIMMRAACL